MEIYFYDKRECGYEFFETLDAARQAAKVFSNHNEQTVNIFMLELPKELSKRRLVPLLNKSDILKWSTVAHTVRYVAGRSA